MYASKHRSISRAILAATALAFALIIAGCKSSAPSAPTDDASLTSALQSRIASDGALSTEPIQSSVQNRIATLTGSVSSEAARSLAAADAAQVAGIKTVVNNLTVQAPAPSVTAAVSLPTPAHRQRLPKPPSPPKPKNSPAPTKSKSAPVVREAPPLPTEPPAPQVATAPPPPPAPELPSAPPPPPPPTAATPSSLP